MAQWGWENPGLPGFADNGAWWDPAGVLRDQKAKPALQSYSDPARPGYNPGYVQGVNGEQQYAEGLTNNVMGNLNTQGMDKYRQEALRTGPSAWSGLARTQLAGDEATQQDTMRNAAASGAAGARSQLAMRGGLSGGAGERIATSSNRDAMTGQQAVAGQALSNRNQIATTDEANRQKQLQALPGMELAQLAPQEWAATSNLNARHNDTTNQISENKNLNDFNMAAWTQEMQRNQAARNADVTMATAPKDKGFLGNIMSGLF